MGSRTGVRGNAFNISHRMTAVVRITEARATKKCMRQACICQRQNDPSFFPSLPPFLPFCLPFFLTFFLSSFLPFPFLSFPFLSFPFLSSFLSFLPFIFVPSFVPSPAFPSFPFLLFFSFFLSCPILSFPFLSVPFLFLFHLPQRLRTMQKQQHGQRTLFRRA